VRPLPTHPLRARAVAASVMTTLDLRNTLPDAYHNRLNTAIAQHVLGWTEKDSSFEECQWADATGERHGLDAWSSSADAVLPLAETFAVTKHEYVRLHTATPYRVELYRSLDDRAPVGWGMGATLAEAACIALLRAHGVEVIT